MNMPGMTVLGRRVLITGGGTGAGASLAIGFADHRRPPARTA
jgi:short-subunit dehydrogenase involved in D-alanine esterification of teichoic acids